MKYWYIKSYTIKLDPHFLMTQSEHKSYGYFNCHLHEKNMTLISDFCITIAIYI